jgi:hypothetical protein
MIGAVCAVRFQHRFQNNVGFAADLSMLVYSAFLAERRIASGEQGHFCINRFRPWRYMSCASHTLECFFDVAAPFKLCEERGRGNESNTHRLEKTPTIEIDGLYFVEELRWPDAVRLSRGVFAPNAHLQTLARDKMKRLGLVANEFVSVHIRRGDSSWEKGEWLGLDKFVVACRRAASDLADIRRPFTVYVATDTAEVVDYFDAVVRDDRMIFVFDREQDRFNLSTANLLELDPLTFAAKQKDDHSVQFLTDLTLMLHAAAFVGTLGSNVGRLVAELRNGSNCHFVDVDQNKVRLRVSTTRLDRPFAVDETSVAAPDADDSTPKPLATYWPSFYGLWPPPERANEQPDRPLNPWWWWRSLLYGRSKKFSAANRKLLSDERREIERSATRAEDD